MYEFPQFAVLSDERILICKLTIDQHLRGSVYVAAVADGGVISSDCSDIRNVSRHLIITDKIENLLRLHQ